MSATDALPDDLSLGPGRLGAAALVLVVLAILSPYALVLPDFSLVVFSVGVTFLLYGLLILGLNLHYGYTGLVNFGHVAFFAVGGYAAALLTAENPFMGVGLGLPWWVGLVASVVAAGALGAVLGLSTLRLRDDFLAIATLAAAEIFHSLVGSFEGVTGGDVGLLNVPRPLHQALGGDPDMVLLTTVLALLGVLLLSYAGIRRLTESPFGRVLRAIRADDLVTGTLGKNVFSYRMQSFILGAALAGLAGGLFAFYNGAVAPGFFALNVTVLVWVGMLIGGPGNHRGVIGGLAIIMGFQLATRFLGNAFTGTNVDFASIRLILIGLLLVLIVRYRPEGFWGNPKELGVDE